LKKKRAHDSEEAAFLAAYEPASFERPSVAVDVVLLGIVRNALRVVLVRRSEHPFLGALALPGGFVAIDESIDAAAKRVLEQKSKLAGVFLEQLYTFGDPARDPRMRVISVAYYALVESARLETASSVPGAILATVSHSRPGHAIDVLDDAQRRLTLAFDHLGIVRTAVVRIRGKLDYAPIGYELLPETFTLLQLQRVHEIVAGRTFNKDSFRRKMLASGALVATGESQHDVGHRPAALYRYSSTPEP
jgi:8-oxo-dGTP diphosphatase